MHKVYTVWGKFKVHTPYLYTSFRHVEILPWMYWTNIKRWKARCLRATAEETAAANTELFPHWTGGEELRLKRLRPFCDDRQVRQPIKSRSSHNDWSRRSWRFFRLSWPMVKPHFSWHITFPIVPCGSYWFYRFKLSVECVVNNSNFEVDALSLAGRVCEHTCQI